MDVESLARQVDAVLNDPLYWFPVRHHSAAVARHVEKVIRQRCPKVIFLEAPAEAQAMVPFVTDKDTRPPIAIYSSYRDDANVLGLAGIFSPSPEIPPKFASWYPLLAYSPEYVVMQTANQVGADVVFIDLPHYALIRPASAEKPPKEVTRNGETESDDAQAGEQEAWSGRVSTADELIASSSFYEQLAEAAGYKSWDEAWDSLFEIAESDTETFRRELATFCAAARATTPQERIRTDGTLERERHFLKSIRDTLAQRQLEPGSAMVVCGGFHLFLDRDDVTPPPSSPSGTVSTTVMPYSFFRLSELSGYRAGNRAPQFYQLAWELAEVGRSDDLVAEHSLEVLRRLRRSGNGTSSADGIAIHQHASMLSGLRGRRVPILEDIQDAIITCCCKGNPADEGLPLRQAIDQANVGTRVGKVTSKLGQLPLVADFFAQLSDLDLGESVGHERRVKLELDKRMSLDDRRSTLLHRLRFLEVPFAVLTESPGSDFGTTRLFHERWEMKWSPNIEPHLIEQTLLGESIEIAVLSKLRERLAESGQNAGELCRHLRSATDMNLPQLIAVAQESCGAAIDIDTRFASLAEAVGHLVVVDRQADHRQMRREVLGELISRGFDRACFSLPDVASAPPEQHEQIIASLKLLAELLLRGERVDLERDVFSSHVQTAVATSTVPFLRGAFLGLLAEMRDITADELAAHVAAYAQTNSECMVEAGDFLDGVMSVSRTSILLGADSLVAAIDELLSTAERDVFLTMLPRLRAAFDRLHDRQIDSFARNVAQRYKLAVHETDRLTELKTSITAAVLLAEVDQQVADIMSKWRI